MSTIYTLTFNSKDYHFGTKQHVENFMKKELCYNGVTLKEALRALYSCGEFYIDSEDFGYEHLKLSQKDSETHELKVNPNISILFH